MCGVGAGCCTTVPRHPKLKTRVTFYSTASCTQCAVLHAQATELHAARPRLDTETLSWDCRFRSVELWTCRDSKVDTQALGINHYVPVFWGVFFSCLKKSLNRDCDFFSPVSPFFFLNSKTVRNYSPMYFYHPSFSLVLACLVLSFVVCFVLSGLTPRFHIPSPPKTELFIYLFIEGL